MSAPDPSLSSTSSAAVDPDPALSSPSTPSLTTITALDSELSTLSSTHPDLALLSGDVEDEVEGDVPKEQAGVVHDLAPVHNILVQLASTLQVKVDLATRELQDIRTRLAREM